MIARAVRVAAAAPLLAVLLTAGGIIVTHGHAPGAAAPCAAATYAHRVALVVEHGDAQSLRECIGFDSTTITGEQILQASGLEFATVGYGSLGDAVCQIDHEPASYPSTCWTTTSPYWVLFVARGGGSWSTANQGASSQTFGDGDAAGFRYDPQTGGAPPPVSPAGACTFSAPTSPPATAVRTAQASAASSAPAQTSAPPTATAAVSAATAGATPSPGVIGVVPASRATPQKPASVDTGLLLAAAGGGVLAGLLVVQVLIRRRRTA
jgi:hypothetical protein